MSLKPPLIVQEEREQFTETYFVTKSPKKSKIGFFPHKLPQLYIINFIPQSGWLTCHTQDICGGHFARNHYLLDSWRMFSLYPQEPRFECVFDMVKS